MASSTRHDDCQQAWRLKQDGKTFTQIAVELGYVNDNGQPRRGKVARMIADHGAWLARNVELGGQINVSSVIVDGSSQNNNIIVLEPEPIVIPEPLPDLATLNELTRWQQERARLLATKKVIRVMHPSDRHEPFIDEDIDNAVYALMRIVQPDIVVRGSDEDDNPTISKWVAEGSEAPEITDFLDKMYVTRRKHTQRTKATCPNAIQINIEGNHGWVRCVRWINKTAKQSKTTLLRRYIENVRCDGEVIWIGPKESIRIGKLVVMHGKYYGPNAAKKTLESRASSVSIMAGHIHDIRLATTMNDKEPVTCMIGGWLGSVPIHQNENDHEDDYTTWQHSTVIGTIDVASGIVTLENVTFHKTDGRVWFVYGSKLYEMAIANKRQIDLEAAA